MARDCPSPRNSWGTAQVSGAAQGAPSRQAVVSGEGASAVGDVQASSSIGVGSWASLADLRDNELTPLSENSGDDPVESTPQLFSDSSGSSGPVSDNSIIVGHGASAPSSGNGVVSHGATGPVHPSKDNSTSSFNVPGAVSHVASGSMRLSGADSVTGKDSSNDSGSVSAGGVVSHGATGPVHPNNDNSTGSVNVPGAVSHVASGSMRLSGTDSVTPNVSAGGL
ncbi:secreted protein C-like [Montipora foliosa]|uniref:secreted protein C-like n=1 Tax=Montipora foliosa TaxID=591990 RepID=UPI0035F15DD5